jgi:hypothetical protein
MAGLNHIREAYQSIYQNQLDERMSDDDKEMRRLAAAERRAGKSDRMDSKSAAKYADSEKKSSEREDKKSKGKHIHGMADSVEVDGDLVDEGMTMKDFKKQRSRQKQKEKRADLKTSPTRRAGIHADKASPERASRHRANVDPDFDGNDEENYPGGKLNPKKVRKAKALGELGESSVPGKPAEKLGAVSSIPKSEQEAARERIKAKTAAIRAKREAQKEEFVTEEDPCWKGYTQVGMKKKSGREVPNCVPSKGVPKAKGYKEELELDERALDAAEKGEKERLVKGMKKSASDFKARYGERAKSVMYATATKKAKEHMDTSKSDRRYSVEEVTMEESNDLENRKKGPRKPSQLVKREKLNKLINDIRSKKQGESN